MGALELNTVQKMMIYIWFDQITLKVGQDVCINLKIDGKKYESIIPMYMTEGVWGR